MMLERLLQREVGHFGRRRDHPVVVTAFALVLVSGCFASAAVGGGVTKGSPTEPTGDGFGSRLGVGASASDPLGVLQGSVEYQRLGDFNLVGVAVEGGLHLLTPRSYLEAPPAGSDAERDRRVLGKMLGGGLTAKVRLSVAGWSGSWTAAAGDPGSLSLEGAIGLAWAKTYSDGGPLSIGLYVSTMRTSYGEENARWTLFPSLAASMPLEPVWHGLVND